MPALMMLLIFAFTLFVSATLLFLVELMVGKMMLPLLGGTPAVWNTCMVFYQAVLLAGYAYAHWSTQWLGTRAQSRFHFAILTLPFLTIAVNATFFSGALSPNESIILANAERPIIGLLIVLTMSVGVPMFVVCTSAPLLQRWFSTTDHPAATDPYFLYGASNLGSMLMLVSYPIIVEPFFTLHAQQVVWVVGAVLLAVFTAVCAVLMWRSRPAVELAGVPSASPAASLNPGSDAIKPAERGVYKGRPRKEALPDTGPVVRPVTWARRLRWCMLAIIPSSLMLGATTYITTDIAAIPLLWIPPLALYLLTFILVFAHIPPQVQSIVTVVILAALMALTLVVIVPLYFTDKTIILFIRVAGIGITAFSLQLLRIRDELLLHRVMIMVMPLVVLLLLFLMLSEFKVHSIGVVVMLHLVALFIVSMVCHGELALDRPEPAYLTEFFLWMSFGGVLGGLFNALFAPMVFNSLVEYPLLMVVACLFLPPLGVGRSGKWARYADIALASVFLLVGGMLLVFRYQDGLPDLQPVKEGPWGWAVFAVVAAATVGGYAAYRSWGIPPAGKDDPEEDHWADRALDLALPAALLVLMLGLYWGLLSNAVFPRVRSFATMLGIDVKVLRIILTFGLPAVLCYTFVERSVRFGLGVGALMLAAGFSHIVSEPPLRQERSFFGVVRVEKEEDRYDFPVNRLVHGTTLHGIQLKDPAVCDTPVTYYHRTGPVGQVFRAYNDDASRPIAVIGLGTGSMATYGRPGQTLDFFDIDPVVMDIAFDRDEFFSFVMDAEDRGVNISLVLGDARLTFQPKGEKDRFRPLRAVRGKPKPERKLNTPLVPEQKYGFIVVDAFSSDAIPVHLITKEAVQIYFDRLMDGGILLMHISNRHLDLHPVLANIADELGVVGYHMSDDDEKLGIAKTRSHWVALVRDKKHLERVLEPLRWHHDLDQQAILGMALWPAAGSAPMMANAGLAYACQAVAEVQARDLAKEEGWKGDPARMRGEWVPLDTPSWLERREEELGREVADIDAQLAKLTEPLASARGAVKAAEKPLAEIREKLKKLDDNIKTTVLSIEAASATAEKARLNRDLAKQQKDREELADREAKLKEDLESASGPRDRLATIEERLTTRKEENKRLIERTPEKKALAKKVKVWSDDYSNLWSVLSWR